MPDCSMLLCHAERCAKVTRVGSLSRGEDALTDSDVSEGVRVVALAADFPELTKGSLVSLSGKRHIVTNARTDPAAASMVVGMSAALDEVRVAYSRPGTKIRFPLDALAVESDVIEPVSDSFAPTASRAWFVAVSADQWTEPTEPQIGDALALDGVNLRVSAVAKRDGFWILTARARR